MFTKSLVLKTFLRMTIKEVCLCYSLLYHSSSWELYIHTYTDINNPGSEKCDPDPLAWPKNDLFLLSNWCLFFYFLFYYVEYIKKRLVNTTYLYVRNIDTNTTTFSREIKAARTIQLAWRKYYAIKREEQIKVKYQSW